jgi:hypothetical protein
VELPWNTVNLRFLISIVSLFVGGGPVTTQADVMRNGGKPAVKGSMGMDDIDIDDDDDEDEVSMMDVDIVI